MLGHSFSGRTIRLACTSCCCSEPPPGAWDRCSSGTKPLSEWHSTAQASLTPCTWGGLGGRVHSRKSTVHGLCWRTSSWERNQTERKWKGTTYNGPVASEEEKVTQSLGGGGGEKPTKNQTSCQFACWLLPTGTLSWASKIWIYQNSVLARATLVIQLDLNWNIWCLLICSNKFTRSWLCAGN